MCTRHPLGLVMLVIASLTSSILFKPFSYLFGLSSTPLPAVVLLLGLVGALLCIADKAADASRSLAGPGRRRQGKGKSSRLSKRRQASHESGVGYAEALDSESAEESARGGESFTVGDATTVSNVSPVVVFERDGSKPLLEEVSAGAARSGVVCCYALLTAHVVIGMICAAWCGPTRAVAEAYK